MNFIKNTIVIILLSGFLLSKPIIIKLATLAPEGTEYYNLLLEMGQRWQEEMKVGQMTNQADLYRHSKANLETMEKDN